MPESNARSVKLEVPNVLAAEIRRVAAVSRRSVQSVANAVLGDRFAGLTPEDIQRRWLNAMSLELGAALEFPASEEE